MAFEHSARIAQGNIIITDLEGNMNVSDTLQCVHCGCHFQVVKGSGRIRGFCRNCMGPTCGSEACMACTPFEKKVDEYEKGKRKTL